MSSERKYIKNTWLGNTAKWGKVKNMNLKPLHFLFIHLKHPSNLQASDIVLDDGLPMGD